MLADLERSAGAGKPGAEGVDQGDGDGWIGLLQDPNILLGSDLHG